MGGANDDSVDTNVGRGAKMHNDTGKSMKKNRLHPISASPSELDAMAAPITATRAAWIRTRTSGIQNRFMSYFFLYSGKDGIEK